MRSCRWLLHRGRRNQTGWQSASPYALFANVPQFVAVPFGKGYTAAEQLGVGVDASGIRIEIYPCLADSVSCTSSGGLLDLSKTPAELGLDVGQEIIMRTLYAMFQTSTTPLIKPIA
jgi:hypothetical protein